MNTETIRGKAQETFATLTRLRDEIRLNLHLASMDARVRWEQMEAELIRFERAGVAAANTASASTQAAMEDLAERFKKFRTTLTEKVGKH